MGWFGLKGSGAWARMWAGVGGGITEDAGQIDLDFLDPILEPVAWDVGIDGELGMSLDGEAESVLEGDTAGADGLATEHWRAEEPTAWFVGIGEAVIGVPIAEV